MPVHARRVWRSVVAGRGILHYKAQAPSWPLVSAGFGQWSSLRMSKLKTKRAAAKRFRFTGTGKAVRGRAYHRHGLTDKPKKAKVERADRARRAGRRGRMVKRMLPYGCRAGQGTKVARDGTDQARCRGQGPPQEGVGAGQGLPRAQQQHLPDGAAAGREGAAVCLPRPAQPQARLPRAVDPADQRGGARRGADLRPADARPEERGIEIDRKVLADVAVYGTRRPPAWPDRPRSRSGGDGA